jgi:hypothetical protein
MTTNKNREGIEFMQLIDCPIDGKDDQIQKVTAAVSSGDRLLKTRSSLYPKTTFRPVDSFRRNCLDVVLRHSLR